MLGDDGTMICNDVIDNSQTRIEIAQYFNM